VRDSHDLSRNCAVARERECVDLDYRLLSNRNETKIAVLHQSLDLDGAGVRHNDKKWLPHRYRGRKARALLGILALTPSRRRPRSGLQDKLWSDRSPEQGAASLRQTLTEIRRAFGEAHRDCLPGDLHGIELAPDRVEVDLDTADIVALARYTEPPQLLEDVDIPDKEFENWLRSSS